ncbi:TetR family transcriptional regulator [Bradyrhizobium sp. STM 3809]|uniref:TetR/AcrR family transcriptional regulator n=1 Tax=Bradyrhizobium sp. STM 3809 TaxID=551936 RepID=UPI0002407DB6|nr:TetR family transcriptional regulator [Bradyrhizobium sp. STM 3809]CCE03130.1 Transcriptional regulator, TetR family [Bradyrhizobium sp. STM 3809]
MARSQKQKEESRQAIVRSAARLFRERGVDGVTVAEIMEGAGLTHGGFPRHFASKDELVTEALADVFIATARDPLLPASDLSSYARAYLRPEHRDAPGKGCVFAALGPEMARATAATRHMLTEAIKGQIDQFAGMTGGSTAESRRVEAIGTWATMIGAMVMARIVDDQELADEILTCARRYLDADS